MCIIILNNKKSYLSNDILKNAFKNNPDGAGFAYSVNNQLMIIKGIFTQKKFIDTYHTIKTIANSDILIHCRIATGGKINTSNCHPHIISDDVCLAHNGILDINPTKSKSDTMIFIEHFLKTIPTDVLMFNPSMKALLEHTIGKSNKMILFNSQGQHTILNAGQGIYEGLDWFSNSSYLNQQMFVNTTNDFLKEEILNKIYSLTPTDFLCIGKNPYIDLLSCELSKDRLFKDSDCLKLSKYDFDIYSEYLSLYHSTLNDFNQIIV